MVLHIYDGEACNAIVDLTDPAFASFSDKFKAVGIAYQAGIREGILLNGIPHDLYLRDVSGYGFSEGHGDR